MSLTAEQGRDLRDALEWKREVIEALIINCIFIAEHEHNPRRALNDLISWEVQVALDPAVSSDAAALIERGRVEAAKHLA